MKTNAIRQFIWLGGSLQDRYPSCRTADDICRFPSGSNPESAVIGRAGLTETRREFCRLLWSPTWRFDDDIYARSAAAFDNPDFVDVVVHSYRHRFGLVDGDPQFEDIERRLSAMPSIAVPTITLEGDADGVTPPGGRQAGSKHFTGRHENRVVANAGHNLPHETPEAFAEAVLDINAWVDPR